MLINFFYALKNAGLPVTVKELLSLLEALSQGLARFSMDDFYYLARTCLVKDETHYDKFDRAFGGFFRELQTLEDVIQAMIPDDWLSAEFAKSLSEEQKQQIQSIGDLEKLMETFKKRLEEQKARHAGGNKWIGTGGTSPFGNSGYHPGGLRMSGESRNKHAAKVWEKREYKNLDDSVEIGVRNIKVALRKLRNFARTGAAEELDIDDTIRSTAHNGGLLDIKLMPERHNSVKVLLFFDVGGSMHPYVRTCEELFSACKTEFKHLEYFYFHNFIYDGVWRDNRMRHTEVMPLYDVIHTFGKDYKLIFVGDASMGPYEIVGQYGSIDFMNPEPGEVWMQRLLQHYNKYVWLNPVEQQYWHYTRSIAMVSEMLDEQMFPLTLDGLSQAIRALS